MFEIITLLIYVAFVFAYLLTKELDWLILVVAMLLIAESERIQNVIRDTHVDCRVVDKLTTLDSTIK